jgi:hypothetical protein
MKFLTLATLCTIACAAIATAQVPSLINYQGRLTDADGAPVTGSKNFVISIYDAATGGTLLYTEDIGAVTLDDNGVYSFQFGGSGTSNTLVTETVATTNGTSTTFQKVLANSQLLQWRPCNRQNDHRHLPLWHQRHHWGTSEWRGTLDGGECGWNDARDAAACAGGAFCGVLKALSNFRTG